MTRALADSESLTAGDAVTKRLRSLAAPVVCVALEDLEGETEDTATVAFEGDVGTYVADERTLSETGSYTVDVPRCETIQFTSANGVTYSVEVRADPR